MGILPLKRLKMETKDRIRQLMEDQHMTQQVFADYLQQSPATLSSIFNGRTRPTLNVIDAIKMKIPNINIEWLLYGTGERYVTYTKDAQEETSAPMGNGVEPMLQFDTAAPPSSFGAPQGTSTTVFPHGVNNTRSESPLGNMKFPDKEPRRVTEIRVYYDDHTYETFVPSSKK